MNEKNKNVVKVSIVDTDYIISSEDDEQYIRQTAAEVENSIKDIMKDRKSVSVLTAAILVALDLRDKFKKSSTEVDSLKERLNNCLTENSNSRMELDKTRQKIEQLKQEVSMLRARFSQVVKSKSTNAEKTPATSIANKNQTTNNTENPNLNSPQDSPPIYRKTLNKEMKEQGVKALQEEIVSFFEKNATD